MIDKLDLNNLLSENERLEYKSCFNKLSKDVWETVSSFENTEGGYLILGIREKDQAGNTVNDVKGLKEPQKILDQFWSNIDNVISYHNLDNNNIRYRHLDNGNTLIQIYIPAAPLNKQPVLYNNRPYIRKGTTDLEAKGEDYKRLMLNTTEDLDTKVLQNYWLDDLDLETINEYKRLLINRSSYQNYQDLDLQPFLERIGVISKDYNGTGKKGLTVGGLLFFGKNNAIIHKFPEFQLEFFDQTSTTKRWDNRISSVAQNLNIFSFYQATTVALFRTINNQFELDERMVRKNTSSAMEIALREALLNMLMHANYYEKNSIRVYAKFNYYEFSNPGKMMIPVDEFFTSNLSKTRNPVISKLFVQLGLGERAGHGGEKIYESAIKNNYRVPEISTDENQTKLKIWKVDFADSFSNQEINNRERSVLKAILSTPSHALNHKDIENKTNLSRTIVTTTLNKLIDKKLITKIGNARSTKYSLQITETQLLAQMEVLPQIMREYLKNK